MADGGFPEKLSHRSAPTHPLDPLLYLDPVITMTTASAHTIKRSRYCNIFPISRVILQPLPVAKKRPIQEANESSEDQSPEDWEANLYPRPLSFFLSLPLSTSMRSRKTTIHSSFNNFHVTPRDPRSGFASPWSRRRALIFSGFCATPSISLIRWSCRPTSQKHVDEMANDCMH